MDLSTKVSKKMRLDDFLRQNLDAAPSPRIIEWVDREAGVFRILWTHQSSGSFHHDDAALFRYWALARGKSTQQSSVELKQSLRMALNKSPSVERLPSQPLKPDYRYFRFVGPSRRRSRAGRQRGARSPCGTAVESSPRVDARRPALWPASVDQDEPINLSLGATKTSDERQFNSCSNFPEKHGNNETMDFNPSRASDTECFSVTCKENIHCSLCTMHATSHFSELVAQEEEYRNCGYVIANKGKSCNDHYFVSPEQQQETVPERPLFRPYALGDTSSNSNLNILLNKQESYWRNESTLTLPMQSHGQFSFFMSPNSVDFDARNTGNDFYISRNIDEGEKYFMIEESSSAAGIINGSNGDSPSGYFYSFLLPDEARYGQA